MKTTIFILPKLFKSVLTFDNDDAKINLNLFIM